MFKFKMCLNVPVPVRCPASVLDCLHVRQCLSIRCESFHVLCLQSFYCTSSGSSNPVDSSGKSGPVEELDKYTRVDIKASEGGSISTDGSKSSTASQVDHKDY